MKWTRLQNSAELKRMYWNIRQTRSETERQRKKKVEHHMLLFESTSVCLRNKTNISSWNHFRNLVNIGTFSVGTNWKTNLFLWGTRTKLRPVPVTGFSVANTQWKHMHQNVKCKQNKKKKKAWSFFSTHHYICSRLLKKKNNAQLWSSVWWHD